MKTKKITALVLAAMMAAGTTTAAFALDDIKDHKDEALVFDDNYTGTFFEEDENGLLVKTDNIINPGDSLFFRLEDGKFANITDKERDRINVYADWKLGKDYIESVDVIYRKGNFQSDSNYQTTGHKYTFKDGKFDGANEFVTIDGPLLEGDNLKNNEAVKALIDSKYVADKGYAYSNTYYETDAELAAKLVTDSKYTDSQVYYTVNGQQFESTATVTDALEAAGFETVGELSSDKLWVDIASNSYFIGADNPGSYSDESSNKGNYYIKPDEVGGKSGKIVDTNSTVTSMAALDTLESVTGIKKVENAYKNASTKKFFDDVAAVAADAVEQKYAVSAVGKYVNESNGITDYDGAYTEATTTPVEVEEVKGAKNGFTYWVEVQTKSDLTTKELDLAGTLYLGTTKNSAEKDGDQLNVGKTLTNRLYDSSNNFLSVLDEVTIQPDANGAVKFDSDAEEVTIYFGENEDAWFTFNAQGQSPLNFAYTTEFNKEIANLFPEANIDFITFTAAPATNRTGDLYITADEDTYLYEVTDKGVQTVAYLPAAGNGVVSAALGLKDIAGAEFDEDEGAWHIRTRKLTSFAISDMELDTSITVDGDEVSSGSSTDNGDKPNPDTGR